MLMFNHGILMYMYIISPIANAYADQEIHFCEFKHAGPVAECMLSYPGCRCCDRLDSYCNRFQWYHHSTGSYTGEYTGLIATNWSSLTGDMYVHLLVCAHL